MFPCTPSEVDSVDQDEMDAVSSSTGRSSEHLMQGKHPVLVARRNARERNRVRQVNMGFVTLRDHIPYQGKSKKLSKVETLRAAASYIKYLERLLNSAGNAPTADGSPMTGSPAYLPMPDLAMYSSQAAYAMHPQTVYQTQQQQHEPPMGLLHHQETAPPMVTFPFSSVCAQTTMSCPVAFQCNAKPEYNNPGFTDIYPSPGGQQVQQSQQQHFYCANDLQYVKKEADYAHVVVNCRHADGSPEGGVSSPPDFKALVSQSQQYAAANAMPTY